MISSCHLGRKKRHVRGKNLNFVRILLVYRIKNLFEGIAPIHYTHHQKAPFLDHTFPVSRMSNQIMIPDLIVLRGSFWVFLWAEIMIKKDIRTLESMFKFYWKLRRWTYRLILSLPHPWISKTSTPKYTATRWWYVSDDLPPKKRSECLSLLQNGGDLLQKTWRPYPSKGSWSSTPGKQPHLSWALSVLSPWWEFSGKKQSMQYPSFWDFMEFRETHLFTHFSL